MVNEWQVDQSEASGYTKWYRNTNESQVGVVEVSGNTNESQVGRDEESRENVKISFGAPKQIPEGQTAGKTAAFR